MSIAVVSIPVADPLKARDFYRDVLLFDVMRDEPMGPEMRWIQLQPKSGGASIALVTWFETMEPGSLQGLLIGIEDVDAEHARLQGLGIAVSAVEEQPWGRFTMLADPDGNGLILSQLTTPDEFRTR